MIVDDPPASYDFRSVEPRWQQEWDKDGLFTVRVVPRGAKPK